MAANILVFEPIVVCKINKEKYSCTVKKSIVACNNASGCERYMVETWDKYCSNCGSKTVTMETSFTKQKFWAEDICSNLEFVDDDEHIIGNDIVHYFRKSRMNGDEFRIRNFGVGNDHILKLTQKYNSKQTINSFKKSHQLDLERLAKLYDSVEVVFGAYNEI